MRTPYVGEIVHFYSFPPSTHPGPQAAIVAFVWKDDQSVNLMVIDPHGSAGTAQGVEVLQPGEKPLEKTSYVEFITEEDRNPDVSIKDNTDGKTKVASGVSGAVPPPPVAKPAIPPAAPPAK